MERHALKEEIGSLDIYLLVQILQGRLEQRQHILDAGCGGGRNLTWLIENGYRVSGIDRNQLAVAGLDAQYGARPNAAFAVADLMELPYADASFDAVICSAVLHFAKDTAHFKLMFSELARVLAAGGLLFVRMTSNLGGENHFRDGRDGVYALPDGSTRFLIDRSLLAEVSALHQLRFLDPPKTTNVSDLRYMSTFVWEKEA